MIKYILVLIGYVLLQSKNDYQLFNMYKKGTIYGRLCKLVLQYRINKKNSYIGNLELLKKWPIFPHGCTGIFISKDAVIGEGAVIFQHVTIGSNTSFNSKGIGAPIIGKNCYIGAGAKIIGNVIIGDNCRIGANCVVVKNMPNNSTAYLGSITIKVNDYCNDNRFITKKIDGYYCVESNGDVKKIGEILNNG